MMNRRVERLDKVDKDIAAEQTAQHGQQQDRDPYDDRGSSCRTGRLNRQAAAIFRREPAFHIPVGNGIVFASEFNNRHD
jgi:hypothetical protein